MPGMKGPTAPRNEAERNWGQGGREGRWSRREKVEGRLVDRRDPKERAEYCADRGVPPSLSYQTMISQKCHSLWRKCRADRNGTERGRGGTLRVGRPRDEASQGRKADGGVKVPAGKKAAMLARPTEG